jgi:SAM-dependent methyltransferase
MTDYYRTHYQDYFNRTRSLDPSEFLMPLVNRLKEGATVLDVGCGSGRDLSWLKQQGFQSQGFERSPGLAWLAREASGCEVIEGDFETCDFSGFSVDAILLVTSLVHLPHHRFKAAMVNIMKALQPEGWVLLSLKQGVGFRIDDDGRTFYLWTESELETALSGTNLAIIESTITLSVKNREEAIISMLLRSC